MRKSINEIHQEFLINFCILFISPAMRKANALYLVKMHYGLLANDSFQAGTTSRQILDLGEKNLT
jgi:hypothetical protein